MELKGKIEERFKFLTGQYERQVKEVLALKETLKNAEAKVNSISGQIEELQSIYKEVEKLEVKNDKELIPEE